MAHGEAIFSLAKKGYNSTRIVQKGHTRKSFRQKKSFIAFLFLHHRLTAECPFLATNPRGVPFFVIALSSFYKSMHISVDFLLIHKEIVTRIVNIKLLKAGNT